MVPRFHQKRLEETVREEETDMTLEQRWSRAIRQIGGAAALLNLPEQVKKVLQGTNDLETKVKMLELIAKNI